MARIELDLAHAYKPNPQRDEDYALLPLKMSFDDGGAYALLGPSGCGKTNPKGDPNKYLSDKSAPWKKLANEKPQGETIAYDTLLNAWKAGKVR